MLLLCATAIRLLCATAIRCPVRLAVARKSPSFLSTDCCFFTNDAPPILRTQPSFPVVIPLQWLNKTRPRYIWDRDATATDKKRKNFVAHATIGLRSNCLLISSVAPICKKRQRTTCNCTNICTAPKHNSYPQTSCR